MGIAFWVWLVVYKGFPVVCDVAFEAWFVMGPIGQGHFVFFQIGVGFCVGVRFGIWMKVGIGM